MVVTHTYIHTHTQKSHPSHPITGLRRTFWQSASPNSWKTTFFLMQWLLKVQERLVWNITHTQIWPGFTGTSLSLTITSVSYGLSQSLNHYGYLCYRLCLLSCVFCSVMWNEFTSPWATWRPAGGSIRLCVRIATPWLTGSCCWCSRYTWGSLIVLKGLACYASLMPAHYPWKEETPTMLCSFSKFLHW